MSATHVHLALNHSPLIITLIGLLILLAALARRSAELRATALLLFLLAALLTVPVYLTGEPTEEAVHHLPDVTHDHIHPHEDAATIAFTAVLLLGLTSLLALVLSAPRFSPRLSPRTRTASTLTPLLLSLIAAALLLYTATLGGRIRHTEIRPDFTPTTSPSEDHHH